MTDKKLANVKLTLLHDKEHHSFIIYASEDVINYSAVNVRVNNYQ